MPLYERIGNLHIHSRYSDGTGGHEEIAHFAAQAGLDFLIVTDHNLYLAGRQGWYGDVLLLVGEELHDPGRAQVNHYLAFNIRE